MNDTVFAVGDIIMTVAMFGAIVFAISYSVFFAWRRTPAGRSLMYFVLALVAWAVQSLASRINPEYLGREWIRIVIYLGIAITIWRLVVILWWSWNHTPFEIEPRKKLVEEDHDGSGFSNR